MGTQHVPMLKADVAKKRRVKATTDKVESTGGAAAAAAEDVRSILPSAAAKAPLAAKRSGRKRYARSLELSFVLGVSLCCQCAHRKHHLVQVFESPAFPQLALLLLG